MKWHTFNTVNTFPDGPSQVWADDNYTSLSKKKREQSISTSNKTENKVSGEGSENVPVVYRNGHLQVLGSIGMAIYTPLLDKVIFQT